MTETARKILHDFGIYNLRETLEVKLMQAFGKPYYWTDYPMAVQIDTTNKCGPKHSGIICEYCHDGNTPILMANFTWKKISEIMEGEYVVGFQVKDGRFSFVPSLVIYTFNRLAETVKIFTDKGSTICTPDHKWMISGSHKYPYSVAKIGSSIKWILKPETFAITEKYKIGWLNGMLRGDGCVKSYYKRRLANVHTHCINGVDIALYHRNNGQYLFHGSRHSKWSGKGDKTKKGYFRLAVKDEEILFQYNDYTGQKLKVQPFKCMSHDNMRMLSSGKTEIFNKAKEIEANWVDDPEFYKGFLAGLFDAEGSYSQHAMRIANKDKSIIGDLIKCLDFFNFSYTIERHKPEVTSILITGGLSEVLRFFTLTQPIVKRKLWQIYNGTLYGGYAKVIDIQQNGDDQLVYNITTSTGNYVASGLVSKNCWPQNEVLCGRDTHADMPMEWIEWIQKDMSQNMPNLLDGSWPPKQQVCYFLNGDWQNETRSEEILKLHSQHLSWLPSQVFTCGTKPDEAWRFCNPNLDWVCVTLSASNPEVYKKVYRADHFNDVLKTMKYIDENCYPDQNLETHYVITENNIGGMSDWYKLIGEKFPKWRRVFSPLVKSETNMPSVKAMGNLTLEQQEKAICEVAGYQAFWDHTKTGLQQPCVLWNNAAITVHGDLLNCCNWSDVSKWNYGNIADYIAEGRTLRDYWMERLANKQRNSLCRNCNLKHPDYKRRLDNIRVKATVKV